MISADRMVKVRCPRFTQRILNIVYAEVGLVLQDLLVRRRRGDRRLPLALILLVAQHPAVDERKIDGDQDDRCGEEYGIACPLFKSREHNPGEDGDEPERPPDIATEKVDAV